MKKKHEGFICRERNWKEIQIKKVKHKRDTKWTE